MCPLRRFPPCRWGCVPGRAPLVGLDWSELLPVGPGWPEGCGPAVSCGGMAEILKDCFPSADIRLWLRPGRLTDISLVQHFKATVYCVSLPCRSYTLCFLNSIMAKWYTFVQVHINIQTRVGTYCPMTLTLLRSESEAGCTADMEPSVSSSVWVVSGASGHTHSEPIQYIPVSTWRL